MNPLRDRRNAVVIGQEKHVPSWRCEVAVARHICVQRVWRNQCERYIDQTLRAIERMSGKARPDQVDPFNLGRLWCPDHDAGTVCDFRGNILDDRPGILS